MTWGMWKVHLTVDFHACKRRIPNSSGHKPNMFPFDLHSPRSVGSEDCFSTYDGEFWRAAFCHGLNLVDFQQTQGLEGQNSCAMELSLQEPVYFSPRAEMHFQQLYLGSINFNRQVMVKDVL